MPYGLVDGRLEGHPIQQTDEGGDKAKHAREKHIPSPPPCLLCQVFRNQHHCPVLLHREDPPYCQLSLPMPERHFCSVTLPPPAQLSPEAPAQGQGCSSDQSEQKHPEEEPSHAAPLPLSIHHCQAAIIEHLHPQFHTAIPPTPRKLAVHLYLQTNMSARYLLAVKAAEGGGSRSACSCLTKSSGPEAASNTGLHSLCSPIPQGNTSKWCYCCCWEFVLFVCIIYTFISLLCEPLMEVSPFSMQAWLASCHSNPLQSS